MAVDPGNDLDPANPQTWNKFAYVRNNPIAYADPRGTKPGGLYNSTRGGSRNIYSMAGITGPSSMFRPQGPKGADPGTLDRNAPGGAAANGGGVASYAASDSSESNDNKDTGKGEEEELDLTSQELSLDWHYHSKRPYEPDFPAGYIPWNQPYGQSVAQAYGDASAPWYGLGLGLAKVSESFGDAPWPNCVRGCLLSDWDRGARAYGEGFLPAHTTCYTGCSLSIYWLGDFEFPQ